MSDARPDAATVHDERAVFGAHPLGGPARRYLSAIDADTDLEAFERALLPRLLPAYGPKGWWADRRALLRAAGLGALKARFGGAPPLAESAVAYDPGIGNPGHPEQRRAFADVHFGQGVDVLGRAERRRAPVRASGTGGAAGRVEPADRRRKPSWLRWYLRGLRTALAALFDTTPRRHAWLAPVMTDIQAYLRVLPYLERAFVFGLYDRRPYVLATFLARHTGVEVMLVYQNIPLYRNCRYLHLPVTAVLTSKVNVAEAEHYRARGDFQASDLVYRSGEYVLDREALEPSLPLYDIGWFSSGEWARVGGLYQTNDLEAIRSGEFAGNPYALAGERFLHALAAFAREHGRTLRIYLHPMERRLFADEGIEPPYAHLADGDLVTLDLAEGDSRRKVYESAVAVSLQSSYIWERLDLGLEASFIHEFPKADMNPFERAALGEYAENLYRDDAELVTKVGRALEERGGR